MITTNCKACKEGIQRTNLAVLVLCSMQLLEPVPGRAAGQSAAEVDHNTLRLSLRNSEFVVVGEVASEPTVTAGGIGGRLRFLQFDFKIAEVLKGAAPEEDVIPSRILRRAETSEIKQGDRLLLFLVPANKGDAGERRVWIGAYWGADVQPASPEMIAAVKRLVSVVPARVSGMVQLAALVENYLPGYTMHPATNANGGGSVAVDALTTPAGKEINLAFARAQWQGTITVLPPGDSARCDLTTDAIYFWRNPTLTALTPSLKLKITAAPAAEDIAQIVLGLFKGPWLLDNWTVKAEPWEDGWLVTPTYEGPPAQVFWQAPIELIVEDGMLKDVRQGGPMLSRHTSELRQADKAEEPGWGEPVDGLSVRLQSDKTVWYFAESLALRLSVRNLGPETLSVPESQELGELEMDGVWYTFSYPRSEPYYVARKPLAVGQQVDNIAVLPTANWSKDGTRIRAVAGKHMLRFAVSALRREPSLGPAVRAVSNPVEVEFRWGVSPKQSATPVVDEFGG